MPGILGKKLGMTRILQDDGRVIPLTLIHCEPNEITQVKTAEKDGYPAIVLGFSKLKKERKNKKFYFRKEFRITPDQELKKGSLIKVDIFKEGELVRITGTSKGKGFQGVMKRHNFSGGPASHGSHFQREPGSIGARAKPGRVHKGKKMAGHMGTDTVTLQKVPVSMIDVENNVIGIKGAVPGSKNSLIIIRKII